MYIKICNRILILVNVFKKILMNIVFIDKEKLIRCVYH